MRKAPIVNLNVAAIIKEQLGDYNETNCEIIHKIADNQKKLMYQCANVAHLENRIKTLIEKES